jgi:hypothetical protein
MPDGVTWLLRLGVPEKSSRSSSRGDVGAWKGYKQEVEASGLWLSMGEEGGSTAVGGWGLGGRFLGSLWRN